MKKIINIINVMFLCGAVLLSSCETTELDLTENPNFLTPDQADASFLLNNVQEDFARFVEGFGRTGAQLTRIDYMGGRDYQSVYSPGDFNRQWERAYQDIIKDLRIMNGIADESGFTHHKGMGQVMEAYIILTLVDFFGPIPYSEAILGNENLNPNADGGADVYASALALLDDAIANFNLEAAAEPQHDFYYNPSGERDWDDVWKDWIKVANTIKMKAYLATRLVDASAVSSFNTIVASGNYITSTDEDFQFRWGTNEIQPDTRHPRYAGSYTATGGGGYMSNSLMSYMKGGGFGDANFDPRILFYFYRQVSASPGQDAPPDEEVLRCSLQTAPLHYDGFVFCALSGGWWGRDHGNDFGIPPDGFLKTLHGVYPAGGALDDFTFKEKALGDGNGGNGITPVMLASWVDFMKAEVAYISGNISDAKDLTLDGVNKSINKVVNFAPVTEEFTTAVNNEYGSLNDMISDFETNIGNLWNSSSDKMEVLSQQYFVSMFGNGIDAYNFYRRTGYPKGLQPNLEPSPGNYIRSLFYPANHANTNSNVTQKSNVGVQVFWDNNPASPTFPSAN